MSVKESDSLECPRTDDLLEVDGVSQGEVMVNPKGSKVKPIPPSRLPFDAKGYSTYQAQPLESKRETLRNQWLNVTYLSLSRAEMFAKSATKKDFGRLMQIATVAGIGFDKVFPKGEGVNASVVLNIFNGLPQARVCTVIGSTPTPKGDVIDVNKVDTSNK